MSGAEIRPEILELAKWMSDAAASVRFGDVRATLRLHNGRITLVEREVAEKIKPEPDEGVPF